VADVVIWCVFQVPLDAGYQSVPNFLVKDVPGQYHNAVAQPETLRLPTATAISLQF
jgi:hypothetical protein